MSRLKSLLHVATPSTCNTQQNPMQVCRTVAQHTHSTQQAAIDVETRCSLHREAELKRLVRLVSDHHVTMLIQYVRRFSLGELRRSMIEWVCRIV